MEFKVCSGCNRNLPATNEFYHNSKNCKDGLCSKCKECRKKIGREYYLKNDIEIKSKMKEYREINKEKLNNKRREDYRNNPEKYKNRRDKDKSKKYYENNKERLLKLGKEWRENNKEKIKIRDREYYQKVKHKRQIRDKEYYENNKELYFQSATRRKQTQRANGGKYNKEQWEECLKFFNYRCAYTGEEFKSNMHIDHIISISNGGTSFIWNLCPSVDYSNMNKGNRELEEWYKKQEYFSEERLNKIYKWIDYAKAKYETI